MSDDGATSSRPAPPIAAAVAIVIGALVLTVWRAPQYLVAPCFWAEDGLFYFAGAWNQSIVAGVVQRPSGYLQLYANLAASFAAWLVGLGAIPLEAAPRVIALAALAAQLLPIALVVTAAESAWGGGWRRAAAVVLVLFGPRTGGMWLNATNSQYFLALAAVVVLLEPADVGTVRRRVHAAVIGLATLAGPVACLLTPLFLWKVSRTRTPATGVAALAAVLGTAVQLGCVAVAAPGAFAGRAHELSTSTIVVVAWMRTIVLPVLGSDAALGFAARVVPSGVASPSLAMAVALVVALVLLVVALALGAPPAVRWRLAGAYGLVTIGSLAGALGDARSLLGTVEGGARYVLVPSVLVLWLLLANVSRAAPGRSAAMVVLLVVALVPSVWLWRQTMRWNAAWPVWSDQVMAWRRHPNEPLHIWPRGWTMRLVPRPGAGVAPSRGSSGPVTGSRTWTGDPVTCRRCASSAPSSIG